MILMMAGAVHAAEYRAGDEVDVQGKYSDDVFAAGGSVDVRIESTDDAYLAGGEVLLDSGRAKNAVLAGGDVTVLQGRLEELIVAGGNVRIQRTRTEGDAVIGAMRAELDGATSIGGTLTAGASDFTLDGAVKGDARIAGAEVRITGRIGGNARIDAENLRIAAGAEIGGDLAYTATDVTIEPGAIVRGKTTRLEPRDREWNRQATVVSAIAAFFGMLGLLLVAPLVSAAFPGIAESGRLRIRGRPWETLGKGLLTTFLVPLALTLLFVTVMGAPFGVALLPFLAAAAILAWAIAVYAIGDQLRLWLSPASRRTPGFSPSRRDRFFWTFLGAAATTLVLWVPLLGFLFCLVAYLAGVGALATLALDRVRER